MNYDQIRVKPGMQSYRVHRCVAQYGVSYTAKCNLYVVIHFKTAIEAVVMNEASLPQITLSLFD